MEKVKQKKTREVLTMQEYLNTKKVGLVTKQNKKNGNY